MSIVNYRVENLDTLKYKVIRKSENILEYIEKLNIIKFRNTN